MSLERAFANYSATVEPQGKDRTVLVLKYRQNEIRILIDTARRDWEVGGPYFPGSAVYAIASDTRGGRHRIWAGPHSMHWGGMLRSSGRLSGRYR